MILAIAYIQLSSAYLASGSQWAMKKKLNVNGKSLAKFLYFPDGNKFTLATSNITIQPALICCCYYYSFFFFFFSAAAYHNLDTPTNHSAIIN